MSPTTTGVSVAALALVLTACTGDDETSDAAHDAGEPSGDLTVWIMDPGNPEGAEEAAAAVDAAIQHAIG